jgi:nucleoside-diphosphate-sugar epimerase
MAIEKVLVTGGTGFIGTPLVEALADAGHRVFLAGRPGSRNRHGRTFIEADLLDEHAGDTLAELRPEIAVLGAWCAEPPGYLASMDNVRWVSSTLAVVRALLGGGCRRIVGLGTCFEYDTSLGYLRESSLLRPRTLYGACKAATCGIVAELCAQFGATFAWPRIFYQYGPREHEQRFVASTIRALLRGQRAPLTAGEQIRDFLHVDDVAAALAAVVLSGAEGPINIGSGRPVSVRELAEIIGEACGRPELLGFGDVPSRPSDPEFICADVSKLRALGWRPRFTPRVGLVETVQWWRGHEEP